MLRLILAASLTESATAVSIAAVTFSEPACRSAARSLAVFAVLLTNSRAAAGTSRFWRFLSASVTGAKASLTVFSTELVSVSVVIWVSPSSGLSYGLTPSDWPGATSLCHSLWCGATSMLRCDITNSGSAGLLCDLHREPAGPPQTSAGRRPAGRRPPSVPGPAPHCARARRYRAPCRQRPVHGRAAALRP